MACSAGELAPAGQGWEKRQFTFENTVDIVGDVV